MGPFTDYKSRYLGGSAAELFEFANLESAISKRYVEALRVAVKFGVRITYCGSIDDQLVSLEVCIGVLILTVANMLTVINILLREPPLYLQDSLHRRKDSCARLVSLIFLLQVSD